MALVQGGGELPAPGPLPPYPMVRRLMEELAREQRRVAQLQREVELLNGEADWLAARVKCDNRFTADQEAACARVYGPCAQCLRRAARRNVVEGPARRT